MRTLNVNVTAILFMNNFNFIDMKFFSNVSSISCCAINKQ